MLDFPVGPRLTEQQLLNARTLPVKPGPVELIGRRVRLTPTDPPRDAPPLHAVSNGSPVTLGSRSIEAYDAASLVWRYLRYGPFADVAEFEQYLGTMCSPADQRSLTLVARETEHPVGIITLMANQPAHLKLEIGNIWVAPVMQGSGIILEACSLLIGYCFNLGYRRIEWKCDALNARSRRTALKLGFTFEGIQEYHYIVKGRNRDTAWFRILDHEWPSIRARLAAAVDK